MTHRAFTRNLREKKKKKKKMKKKKKKKKKQRGLFVSRTWPALTWTRSNPNRVCRAIPSLPVQKRKIHQGCHSSITFYIF